MIKLYIPGYSIYLTIPDCFIYLTIPNSLVYFGLGVLIILLVILLAVLTIRSTELRITTISTLIFVSFIRLFLVQCGCGYLLPLVTGLSMSLILFITCSVRRKKQPSLLYYLLLFLGGCLIGYTIPLFLEF